MKIKLLSIMIALTLLGSTAAIAGNSIRIGSAGAQELLMPVGARGYALGGAVIADASGVEATFWNPAGVSRMDGTEIMFMNMPYFADIEMNFFGLATQWGDLGTVAAAVKVVDIGDIEETTEQDFEGTGNTFSPTLSVIGLTFSRQMSHQVNFGVTVNLINERIADVSANAISVDMGFMFDPRWNGVQVGMVIKNVGTDIQFRGSGFDVTDDNLGARALRSTNAKSELPTHVVLGASYTPQTDGEHSFTFSGNFQSNEFTEDVLIGGAEYSYDGKYFLRGAYSYSQDVENDDGDVIHPYMYGLSVGAGFSLDLNDTRVTFEGAWREMEFFDSEVVFSGKINF